ncbi:MAG: GNAT family N-acetyltransferase [Ruminococcus sp.]|nr:GNAT family N-acetyltransferase [Ruminococcus sp.]
MPEFVLCRKDDDLQLAAALADEIWHEHFPGIISLAQTDYMVGKFQSFESIKEQVENENYSYYLITVDDEAIGYFAIAPKSDGTMFLSKLYIRREHRGNHYSTAAFRFICDKARELGLGSVWLTVNKNNDRAIAAYEAFGMKVARTQQTDIGDGFIMDDYVYELKL